MLSVVLGSFSYVERSIRVFRGAVLTVLLYSNWPTFPQVYMNGELVGGADIMLQMHQSGKG